ncbi:MAG: glycosyltransferase family 4 protein, partial [Candidatus Atribacteria bacterium]|nr:glycosyltransferase family 4 protein [Candidatus Atribacteria bacterium]
MRIAIDGRMGETRGGIGVYTRELLYQLAEMDSKNQYFVIVNKSGNLKIGFNANNFLIVESSVSRKQYFIKDIWHQFFLPFFLKANHIDIYFNPRYILPYCSRSKMIVTIHDMIAFLYPEIWPGISGFRIRQYIRISSKRADKILTVSNCAKNDIMRILNIPEEKIKVIPCGINEKLYNPNHDKSLQNVIIKKYGIRKKFILVIGPLGHVKNHDRLIDAYSILPEHIREDYQLIITGEKKGTYSQLLKKTGKNRLSDDIVF